jgi:hypothetical protein
MTSYPKNYSHFNPFAFKSHMKIPKNFETLYVSLIFILVVLSGCFSESKVDVAQPSTFVRSYSNGYNIETLQVEQTSDGGFIILGNTEIQDSEADPIEYKIILVKTDQFGNQQDMFHFPAVGDNSRNFSASSILLLPDGGYLITGAEIQETNVNTGEITKYRPLIMTVSSTGSSNVMTYSVGANARTMAAAIDATANDNNFLVLESSEDLDSSMVVRKISSANLSTTWYWKYAAEETILAKRIFSEGSDLVFFGGTATKENRNDGRLVRIEENNPNPGFDNPYGKSDADETINDICRFGTGFAMIGKTNSRGNDDIFFIKLSKTGSFTADDSVSLVTEILADAEYNNQSRRDQFEDLNTKNEAGKSISTISDGGLIILGTIDSYGDPIPLGAGNIDIVLLKINAFGDRQWARTLGGLDADEATCVRETTDNGFIVLGTTRLGARGTMLLVKTDDLGNVD